MTAVAVPIVQESFQRALHEVIAPFLSTGNQQPIMGSWINFYKCKLLYHLSNFPRDPTSEPFICFSGTRSSPARHFKCKNKLITGNPNAYEVRQTITRSVYVGLGRGQTINLPPYTTPPVNRQASPQDVEAVWSQLFMVLEHEHRALNERGIFNPRIPPVPAEYPHDQFYIVRGDVSFDIHFPIARKY